VFFFVLDCSYELFEALGIHELSNEGSWPTVWATLIQWNIERKARLHRPVACCHEHALRPTRLERRAHRCLVAQVPAQDVDARGEDFPCAVGVLRERVRGDAVLCEQSEDRTGFGDHEPCTLNRVGYRSEEVKGERNGRLYAQSAVETS